MNWKKLIGFGLLFWVIMFVVWSIVAFIPGLSEMWMWVIGWAANALVAFLLAHWYFYKVEDKGFGQGLLFGLVALVIAAILDSAISVPLFIKEGHAAFFGAWQLWVGFVVVLIFAGIAGSCRCKKCSAGSAGVKMPEMEEKK